MIVVSDSSPLIALSAIGKLDLLRVLFGQLVVPEAVYDEVTAAGTRRVGAEAVMKAPWIEVRPVANQAFLRSLQNRLDPGEAAAIALAVEEGASLVLLDEQRGRREAQGLGLTVTGVVGVVIRAKRAGLIASVRPVLDELRLQGGFWLSDRLYAQAVRLSGE